MTPQEQEIVDKCRNSQSALKAAEIGFIQRLANFMDQGKQFTLTAKQSNWLHSIDKRLCQEGIYWNPPRFTTIGGKSFYIDEIRMEDITIEDIAHGLSNICRFGGHCSEFYSVAQHSIRVAGLVSDQHRLQALLHDAPEAYLGDIPTPLKKLLPDYRKLESQVWNIISIKFDVPEHMDEQIKVADTQVYKLEAAQLTQIYQPEAGEVNEYIMAPEEAREAFLDMFNQLTRKAA